MSPAQARRRPTTSLQMLLAACALGWAALALADDAASVQQLIGAGHWSQALTRLDALATANPGDPRWGFYRGLALSATGQNAAAIDAYTRLTQRYPELPEPYNNLGVLQAQSGQLEAARQSLNQALQANPDFGLARENLGDVEVQLALADYRGALQLPGHSPALAAKLKQLQADAPKPSPAPVLRSTPNLP